MRPAVHLLALGAFVAWLWISGGDVRLSLNIAVAVLIITCPCALGLAVPAVTTAASGRLFRQGMLLKSATATERLAEVDHVVFDKTGTLTEGKPVLDNLGRPQPTTTSRVALALAQGSSHPLAQAIVAAAQRGRAAARRVISDVERNPGPRHRGDLGGPGGAARPGRMARRARARPHRDLSQDRQAPARSPSPSPTTCATGRPRPWRR